MEMLGGIYIDMLGAVGCLYRHEWCIYRDVEVVFV